MKILITGAAGGIGSTLGYYLFRNGHQLVLVDNLRNGYAENLVINGQSFGIFFQKNICDGNFADVLKNDYDCIIHLAAITSLPDCENNSLEAIKTNTLGTMNILECAKKWSVPHVIFASTSAVYENNKEDVFTENLQTNPRLWYSLSKKMAEEICESYRINYGMNITTLRFFNVFGPRQDIYRKNPPLLNYLVKQLQIGNSPILHSDGQQKRDYIHVDDVVQLIEICIRNQVNDTFNVCSGVLLSVNQIFEYVSEVLFSDVQPIYKDASALWDTYPDLFNCKYPLRRDKVEQETNKYSLGSWKKAKDILGWEPNTDLQYLIKKVVKEIKI